MRYLPQSRRIDLIPLLDVSLAVREDFLAWIYRDYKIDLTRHFLADTNRRPLAMVQHRLAQLWSLAMIHPPAHWRLRVLRFRVGLPSQ